MSAAAIPPPVSRPPTCWWTEVFVDEADFQRHVRTMSTPDRLEFARRGRYDDRVFITLANDDDSFVQLAAVERCDLDDSRRSLVARRGGPWAVASVVAGPDGARMPWYLMLVCHRIVRRSVARSTTNPALIALWSRTRDWDVGRALAENPRLGRFAARTLAARGELAVHVALARRDDVGRVVHRLRVDPSVQLTLAGNPSTPAPVVRRLLESADPFVRLWAAGHPSVPAAEALRLAADPSTPAWAVRRIAHHPGLDERERDSLLAWLALGGGEGDPEFDPNTCNGSPGSVRMRSEAYAAEARRASIRSPLWKAREMWVRDHPRVHRRIVRALARDPSWEVRRAAAAHRLPSVLEELAWDENALVATRAQRTLEQMGQRRIAASRFAPRIVSRTLVWVGFAIGGWGVLQLAFGADDSSGDRCLPTTAVPDSLPIADEATDGPMRSTADRPTNSGHCR